MQNTRKRPSGEARGNVMLFPVSNAETSVSLSPQILVSGLYGIPIKLYFVINCDESSTASGALI